MAGGAGAAPIEIYGRAENAPSSKATQTA